VVYPITEQRFPFVSLIAIAGLLVTLCGVSSAIAQPQNSYFPPYGDWQRRAPSELGFNKRRLSAAVKFAIANENPALKDLEQNQPMVRGKEPLDTPLGPFRDRGPQAGLVIKDGYIVAEWGDTSRVDMTFSVTKSFLSTTVGLAVDDGLIRDVHDPVRDYFAPVVLPVGDGEPGKEQDGIGTGDAISLFESAHNRKITWDHLLRQTSDWEGTLWGKPDWADRPGDDLQANRFRDRNPPGSVYKYNDVRVNLLALAALQIWRQPLPQVLKERVMDPIGASRSWRWHGYENSWVTIDGLQMNSVSGGGHWGGGMHLSAFDQARFGLLLLNQGRWETKQLLSERWLAMAETPGKANAGYGFMNFYFDENDNGISHFGAGTNMIHIDRKNNLVVVARWIQSKAIPEFLEKITAALR